MKKGGIIALVVIAVAIGIMITTFGDAGSYESFAVAKEHVGKTFHVVGKINREKEMYYQPEKDPNYFTFYMFDSLGHEMKVIYNDTKPPEFEMSDKVVLVGKALNEGEFKAQKILTKCPSKYKEEDMATMNP